jgi:hypothetical protein
LGKEVAWTSSKAERLKPTFLATTRSRVAEIVSMTAEIFYAAFEASVSILEIMVVVTTR